MNALASDYGDDDTLPVRSVSLLPQSTAFSAAPTVPTAAVGPAWGIGTPAGVNLPASVTCAPILGPQQTLHGAIPASAATLAAHRRGVAGISEAAAVDPAAFDAEFHRYTRHGYAYDPSGTGAIVGHASAIQAAFGAGAVPVAQPATSRGSAAAPGKRRPEPVAVLPTAGTSTQEGAQGPVVRVPGKDNMRIVGAVKRARMDEGEVDDVESWQGPWAGFEGEHLAKVTPLEAGTLTAEQQALRKEQGYNPTRPGKLAKDGTEDTETAARTATAPAWSATATVKIVDKRGPEPSTAAAGAGAEAAPTTSSGADDAALSVPEGSAVKREETKSIFHGREEFDYQGRSWVEAPKGMRGDGGDHECFVPKKMLHKYTGHNKGVQVVEFFPGTGHLIMSASLDGKVKIWDTCADRHVRRTYLGHAGGVRDAKFGASGLNFLSASYDRHVKLWDTETGACLSDFAHDKVPNCVTWDPNDPNIFLVGSANRKLIQYDIREGKMVLEYDYHLGGVTTITFFDGGRRLVSTGEDRQMLVWDYNAPVPIKYIKDPTMMAIPAVAMHPDGESFVGQSMDNKLVVYHSTERVSLNRKKTFTGHVTAGYACRPCFSPNGRFVASGDGEGQLWFWEWKNTHLFKKMKAHDASPTICTAWHPLEPSIVATCSWDGTIKLWR